MKKGKRQEKPVAENYYDLKTDAVNRLVSREPAPQVSKKEIQKYTSRRKLNIPSWFKIVFVKFWFSGAICYFFLWGLGLYISGLDLMAALAIGLGVSTDLMVNHLLHFFEPEEGAYNKWMMIPSRKFWTIFLNVIYAGVVLFGVIQAYRLINIFLAGGASDGTVAVPVEPILFGLLYMGVDMLLITLRNTMVKIFRDANEKVSAGRS